MKEEVLCLKVQWAKICNRSLLKTYFEKGGRHVSEVKVKCAKLSKGIVGSYSVGSKGFFHSHKLRKSTAVLVGTILKISVRAWTQSPISSYYK